MAGFELKEGNTCVESQWEQCVMAFYSWGHGIVFLLLGIFDTIDNVRYLFIFY